MCKNWNVFFSKPSKPSFTRDALLTSFLYFSLFADRRRHVDSTKRTFFQKFPLHFCRSLSVRDDHFNKCQLPKVNLSASLFKDQQYTQVLLQWKRKIVMLFDILYIKTCLAYLTFSMRNEQKFMLKKVTNLYFVRPNHSWSTFVLTAHFSCSFEPCDIIFKADFQLYL